MAVSLTHPVPNPRSSRCLFLKDFLAKNGANFVRSYSNNPMCVPSRTSMMTGRSSLQLGVWGNRDGLAASPKRLGGVLDESCVKWNGEDQCRKWAEEQGYPEHILSVFEKLGYKVHMDGRIHIGAATLNEKEHSAKVDGRQSCSAFDDMRLGEVTRSSNLREAPGDTFKDVFLDGAKVDGGDTGFGMADWAAVDGCSKFIEALPEPSAATKPFFLHCSFNLPHYSFSTNSTWLQSVHDDKITLPTWNAGFPDSWHPYDSFMSIAKGVDGTYSESDIKKLKRVYYGMVAESDTMLQNIWNALVAKGYGLDNTYVVYVSDHGELKFDHRQVYKASLYEGSVRVPTQIAGPGIKKGAQIDTHVTSLLDIFPTLLDMAQVDNWKEYGEGLTGSSLLEAAGGTSVAPKEMKLSAGTDSRDLVISNYNWVEGNTGAFMVRTGRWKMMTYGHTYAAYKNYAPQLFDMEADPDELRDVAKQHPDIVAMLDKRLREVMDPDEADRRVVTADFERLKTRFDGKIDPNSKDLLSYVKKEVRPQFQEWVE